MTERSPVSPSFADGAAHIDGTYVPVAEARIPILDWGFLRSDATYDVAHVWEGRFFRLEDHLDRFERSMQRLHLTSPVERDAMRSILHRCVAMAGLTSAYVEMICTRGLPPPGSRDPRECRNAFFAFAIPFVWIASPEKQEQGLHLIVSDTQRIAPQAVDPTIKNYHWLDMVSGLYQAYERGGETCVLVDAAGNIVEGPGFNIFAARKGTLVTPDRGMLEGITRRTVIELAGESGLRVEQRPLPAGEARAAPELFLSSTAGGVIPVTRIDGRPVGDGAPGPTTRQLQALYWAAQSDPRFATPVDYHLAAAVSQG